MLVTIEAAHVRVACDSCGVTAEVCGHRDLPVMARVAAVRKFHAIGWHHDPCASSARAANARSARAEKESSSMGSGRWYCPGCASKTHL